MDKLRRITTYVSEDEMSSNESDKDSIVYKLKRDSFALMSKSRSAHDTRTSLSSFISTSVATLSSASSSSFVTTEQTVHKENKKSVFFISDELQQSLNVQTATELSIKRREYEDKEEIAIRGPYIGELKQIYSTNKWKWIWSHFQPQKLWKLSYNWIMNNIQISTIFISIIIAAIMGIILHGYKIKLNALELFLISFPGKFYIRAMTGLLTPLLAAMTISSIGKLEYSNDRKLFRYFVFFAIISNALAIGLSVLLMYLLTPGAGHAVKRTPITKISKRNLGDTIADTLRHMISNNVFQICLNSTVTDVVYVGPELPTDPKKQTLLLINPENWSLNIINSGFTNYLGIITVSAVIGFMLQNYKINNENLFPIIECLENTFSTMTQWFSWYAPIGKFFLFLEGILELNFDHNKILLKDLFKYFLVYVITVAIHMFVIIPLYVCLLTRTTPWHFIKHNVSIMVLYTCFSTKSSLITIPTTLEWLESNLKISSVEARLLIPLGATMNKNGSAIWFTVTTLFLTQALKLDLNIWTLLAICLSSFVASIDVSPLPYSAVPLQLMVEPLLVKGVHFGEVNSLTNSLSVIDGLIDRIRTTANVYSDVAGAIAIHQINFQSLLPAGNLLTWEQIIKQQDDARRISQRQTDYVTQHRRESKVNEDELLLTSVTSLDMNQN